VGVKYKAVAELRTKDNRTIVLRFHNLTFTQAKAFQKTFDQFDHIHSDADLTFHGWSEVKSGWDALEVEIIEKDEIFSD
jgi:hypothetical protein